MSRGSVRWLLLLLGLLIFPQPSPAPLVYRPGEGWTYESAGGESKWRRERAKDQLEVAQEFFGKKDYGTARKAARRVVNTWPLSDYAPEAQYLLGRTYEERGADQKAFEVYQQLLTKYPKIPNYEAVLQRQYEIANRFLAGQWFKLWGYIPFFPSMEKTREMYEKLIKNGPYSEVAAQAQLKIGQASEKQRNYPAAVKAYTTAADRYHDRTQIAADALYKAGLAYHKQANTAEYDQSIAAQAIATFTDFIALYPKDGRVTEAQKIIADLKTEQARGNFQIARFYEKRNRPSSALIYYNEVINKDPNSPYADNAKQRIASIKKEPFPETAPTPSPARQSPPAISPEAQRHIDSLKGEQAQPPR